jgi:trypsin
MRRFLALLAAVAATLLVATPASAITNGEPDAGRHPYVGLAVFDTLVDGEAAPSWRCSGTLLSPTVFLVAGHCTSGAVAARVWLAEDVQSNPEYPLGGATSYEGTPYTYPGYCDSPCGPGLPEFAHFDVGLIVLSEPVPTSVVAEYGQLPSVGLVDTLATGADVDLVGYGVQVNQRGGGKPVWTGPRVRLYAPTEVFGGNYANRDEFIKLRANPGGGSGGTCFGDSGGPILLGDTVLGVNSFVTNNNCTGVTYASRIDLAPVLAWIESYL